MSFFTKCRLLFLFSASLLLKACVSNVAPLDSEVEEDVSSKSSTPIIELQDENYNNVELIWQALTKDMEGFLLKIGESPTSLGQELRVPITQIDIIENTPGQISYRYIVRDMPPDKSVFMTISSYIGGTVSQPSEVFEIKPRSK